MHVKLELLSGVIMAYIYGSMPGVIGAMADCGEPAEMRNMVNCICVPRMTAMRRSIHGRAVTPVSSVLERIREALLKLIMLSALMKQQQQTAAAAAHEHEKLQTGGATRSSGGAALDSYRSQAVEECIQFAKRSAGALEENLQASSAAELR